MHKSAIVSVVLGNDYLEYWKQYCEPGWREYASRHGLDVILISQPLDASDHAARRSPSWQKCLVLSQEFARRYQRIVWIDADVVINPQAPSILDGVPADKVGGTFSGACIHDDLKPVLLERLGRAPQVSGSSRAIWEADQRAFYAHRGMDDGLTDVVQGGVLVLNPQAHASLLERVYSTDCAEDRGYEQAPLSRAILRENLFFPVDSRFNTVFFERLLVHYPYLTDSVSGQLHPEVYDLMARWAVRTQFLNSYFLHFAYDQNWARYLL